jgi:hypothetical protein
MSHYAKLATVAVRLVATVIFLLGAMGVAYFVFGGFLSARKAAELAESLISGVVYAAAGLILFALSKPIGRLLARGVET